MTRLKTIISWAAGCGVAAALGAGAPAAAQTGDAASADQKLQRQVDVFEKFASQMLLDSPNFLVGGSHAARGIHIDCFGVLVSFNASLVQKDDEKDWKWWDGDYDIKREGDKIIVIPKGDKSGDGEEIDYEDWMDRREKQQARTYERGKQELTDLLLDYGDLITRLEDDKFVAVAGFLGDAEYLEEKGISHLVVKAGVRDLKAYGAGDIDEATMAERLIVEEY